MCGGGGGGGGAAHTYSLGRVVMCQCYGYNLSHMGIIVKLPGAGNRLRSSTSIENCSSAYKKPIIRT